MTGMFAYAFMMALASAGSFSGLLAMIWATRGIGIEVSPTHPVLKYGFVGMDSSGKLSGGVEAGARQWGIDGEGNIEPSITGGLGPVSSTVNSNGSTEFSLGIPLRFEHFQIKLLAKGHVEGRSNLPTHRLLLQEHETLDVLKGFNDHTRYSQPGVFSAINPNGPWLMGIGLMDPSLSTRSFGARRWPADQDFSSIAIEPVLHAPNLTAEPVQDPRERD